VKEIHMRLEVSEAELSDTLPKIHNALTFLLKSVRRNSVRPDIFKFF
jgi:hypothetical protein